MSWRGLRFANPKSNVDQLIDLLQPLAQDFDTRGFGLDQMRDSLAHRGLISSTGATGERAVERSVQRASKRTSKRDTSRDPLYNQCKMMSEIYRGLGWLRSLPNERLRFRLTNFGWTLAQEGENLGSNFVQGALRESLLNVVFPNETTTNIGISNSRPYVWILRLASALGGVICRDEIILSALSVRDDQLKGLFDDQVNTLLDLRSGPYSGLQTRVAQLAADNGVQLNTLKNYTRIPNGFLASKKIGWAERVTDTGIYGRRNLAAYVLAADAMQTVKDLPNRFDVRAEDLALLTFQEQTLFADYGYYMQLKQSGIANEYVDEDLARLSPSVEPIFPTFGISSDTHLLFNPELQCTDEVLSAIGE